MFNGEVKNRTYVRSPPYFHKWVLRLQGLFPVRAGSRSHSQLETAATRRTKTWMIRSRDLSYDDPPPWFTAARFTRSARLAQHPGRLWGLWLRRTGLESDVSENQWRNRFCIPCTLMDRLSVMFNKRSVPHCKNCLVEVLGTWSDR